MKCKQADFVMMRVRSLIFNVVLNMKLRLGTVPGYGSGRW